MKRSFTDHQFIGKGKKVHRGAGLWDSKPQTQLSGLALLPSLFCLDEQDGRSHFYLGDIYHMSTEAGLKFREADRREDRRGNKRMLDDVGWVSWMLGIERSGT